MYIYLWRKHTQKNANKNHFIFLSSYVSTKFFTYDKSFTIFRASTESRLCLTESGLIWDPWAVLKDSMRTHKSPDFCFSLTRFPSVPRAWGSDVSVPLVVTDRQRPASHRSPRPPVADVVATQLHPKLSKYHERDFAAELRPWESAWGWAANGPLCGSPLPR